jgi:hypothetical protein
MAIMDLTHYIPHAIVTAGGTVLTWLGKNFVKEKMDRFEDAAKDIKETKALVDKQNRNHLEHIEEYTKESRDTLQRIETSHAEMNGYLKAIAEKQ